MIYVLGMDTDPGFVHFLRESSRQGAAVQPVNIKAAVCDGDWHFALGGADTSTIRIASEVIHLDPNAGHYARIPNMAPKQTDDVLKSRWENFYIGINSWLEEIPGRVVNRPDSAMDNFAKPLHESHIAGFGISVPDALTTADPERLRRFCAAGPTIIKSASSARSNASLLTEMDLHNFVEAHGPIHVQRIVRGADVRAHVVDNDVHAEIIVSDALDYRDKAAANEMSPHTLPPELARKLVDVTASFGLSLAGWDFKLDSAGNYWCLEANSMPGYFGYDRRCGGAITRSIVRYLA